MNWVIIKLKLYLALSEFTTTIELLSVGVVLLSVILIWP
jgi:hypothetical protein